jgi:hypothetical protein
MTNEKGLVYKSHGVSTQCQHSGRPPFAFRGDTARCDGLKSLVFVSRLSYAKPISSNIKETICFRKNKLVSTMFRVWYEIGTEGLAVKAETKETERWFKPIFSISFYICRAKVFKSLAP